MRFGSRKAGDRRGPRIFFGAGIAQEALGVELGFPRRPREAWDGRGYEVVIAFYSEADGVCRILTLAASGDRELM